MNGTLVVFARTPELGRVKTRLGRVLGDHRALELHRAFLLDTLEAARAVGVRVVLARTPGPPGPEAALADATALQEGPDFGTRFDGVLMAQDGPVVLVGSDTPHLSPDAMRRAFERLRTCDVVVGPAPRGGFHLIGFQGRPFRVASVFGADDEVAALRALAAKAGCSVALLPACRDLDEVIDLEAVRNELAARGPDDWLPPRTAALLT